MKNWYYFALFDKSVKVFQNCKKIQNCKNCQIVKLLSKLFELSKIDTMLLKKLQIGKIVEVKKNSKIVKIVKKKPIECIHLNTEG